MSIIFSCASFDVSTNRPAGTTHDAGVNVFNGCSAGTTHDAGFDIVQLVLPMMLGIMLQIAILWVPQMKQVTGHPYATTLDNGAVIND